MPKELAYVLEASIAKCIMPDGTVREVNLEAPNDESSPFEVYFIKNMISEDYRDPTYTLRPGFAKYELEFRYSYESHRINCIPLLLAEKIILKVPVYYYEDSRYYEDMEVILLNKEFVKSKYDGLNINIAGNEQEIPFDSESLEFISKSFTWDEFEDLFPWKEYKTLVGDDGYPIIGFIEGEETDDGNGIEAVPMDPAEYGSTQTRTYSLVHSEYDIETINLESNNE